MGPEIKEKQLLSSTGRIVFSYFLHILRELAHILA